MSYSFLESTTTPANATRLHAEPVEDSSPAAAAQLRRESLLAGCPLQRKLAQLQREAMPEEEEPLQGKFERVTGSREAVQRKVDPTTKVGGMLVNDDPSLETEADVMGAKATQFVPSLGSSSEVSQQAKKPNATGLPDHLKSGIESLSGMSMDEVKVHYNSEKPAQLNALAYAQGTDIHVGPGQERHLPHEAWHVVQQGR